VNQKLAAPLAELTELPPDERSLGPFRLERQLGRGGFAPVWLAKEIFSGAELRTAAVKLFSLRAADVDIESASQASAAARHKDQVIREAQALCKVEHPNVVRFYSIAVDEARGVIGLAMEYVTGTPLDRALDTSVALAPADVIEVGLAVASALAAVHAAGLVHRDVKPSNVVEAGGVYKLIDFGIAAADVREMRPRAGKRVVLDDLPFEIVGTKMSMLAAAYTVRENDASSSGETAFVTGTVGYIDPVVVSTGAPADASSDLYGLGAMLYECLTGKVPAAASARIGTGLSGEVLDGRSRPTPVRTLATAAPEPLAKLVDALVSPDRADRPASARAVANELARVRDAGRAPTELVASTDAPPPTSRSRAGLVLGAVAALVGIAAIVASRRPALPPGSAPVPAASAAATERPCSAGAPDDCATQCDRGAAEACYTLALLYEDGRGVAKDLARAATLHEKACDAGSAAACYASGRLLEMRKDPVAALSRYGQGCEKGSAQACNALGRAHSEGLGTAKDVARAKDDYQRACDGGYVTACANLGVLYERGDGVAKDPDKARDLYKRACDDGSAPAACGDLAHFYADGLTVPEDDARAAALYQRACDGGYPAGCGGLGLLLAAGRGAPKDSARAADLLQTGCDDGGAAYCAALAKLYAAGDGVARDRTRAASLFALACDGGTSSACTPAAPMPIPARPAPTPPQPAPSPKPNVTLF
jgi:TPR repeat protein/serine/threonine protein kinase